MAYLSIVALALLVVVVVTGAFRQHHKNKNLEAAWEHRRKIAHVANEIEHDPEAPQAVKEFIGELADSAFNDALLHRLYNQFMSRPKSQRQGGGHARLIDLYGKRYGSQLHSASIAFAHLVIYSDPKKGKALRLHLEKRERREQASSVAQSVAEFFRDCSHHNGSGHACA